MLYINSTSNYLHSNTVKVNKLIFFNNEDNQKTPFLI